MQRHWKKVKLQTLQFKAAAKQLHLAWNPAHMELQKAHKGRIKQIEESEKARKRHEDNINGRAVPAAKRGGANSAVDAAFAVGEPMLTYCLSSPPEEGPAVQIMKGSEMIGPALIQPVLVHGGGSDVMDKTKYASVVESLEQFASDCASSEMRKSSGRALRKNVDDADDDVEAEKGTMECCPAPAGSLLCDEFECQDCLDPLAAAKIKWTMVLSDSAARANTLNVVVEKSQMASMRYIFSGSRKIACVSTSALQELMRKRGITGTGVQDWFKEQREAGLNISKGSGINIYYATIAPKQWIYLPGKHRTAEMTLNEDFIGVRCGLLLGRDGAYIADLKGEAGRKIVIDSSFCVNLLKIFDKPRAAGPSAAAAKA